MSDSSGKPLLCPKRCSVPIAHCYLAAPNKLWTKYSGSGRVEITSYPCITAPLKLEIPWKRDGKYSYPPPLQYLPLLGLSRAVALQGAGQHHPPGSDGSYYLGLIALCHWGEGGAQQWLENRLWKERLTC